MPTGSQPCPQHLPPMWKHARVGPAAPTTRKAAGGPKRPKATHLQGLHEGFGARFGNSAQVVDEVSFGHPDTGVQQGESAVPRVGDDVDLEVLPSVQLGGVGQALVADLVQRLQDRTGAARCCPLPDSRRRAPRASPHCSQGTLGAAPAPLPPPSKDPPAAGAHVGGVGDELPQEDLLVGVERVDDERHELRDLRLEGERLHLVLSMLHLLGHLQGNPTPFAPRLQR